MRFHVVLRACAAVESVHGVPRPFGLAKAELMKISFLSLADAAARAGAEVRCEVIGDRLTPEWVVFYERFGARVHAFDGLGNDESLRRAFSRLDAVADEDWMYLTEDDYLHQPRFFSEIRAFVERRSESLRVEPRSALLRRSLGDVTMRDLFLHPSDYPDFYRPERQIPSYVFRGEGGVWRQVNGTTFCLLLQGATFRKHRRVFAACADGANDGRLSRTLFSSFLPFDRFFRNRGLCLAPFPSLSAHMHVSSLPPFTDWETAARRWQTTEAEASVSGFRFATF